MRLDVVTNKGIRTLKEELEVSLKECRQFCIASAFITYEGIKLFNLFLNRNKHKDRTGRILISLYNGFNSRETLRQLKEVSSKSNGRIQAHISRDLKFHWKYYQFELKAGSVLFVGSANLTKSGIEERGELQAKIVCSSSESKVLSAFEVEFDKEWQNSIDILQFPVDKYDEIKQRFTTFKLHKDIKDLLYVRRKEGNINKEIKGIILVHSTLSQRIVNRVYESQTRWDREGWDFYCSASKNEFEKEGVIGNVLLMIEKQTKRYRFRRIIVRDNCIFYTSEGKYFIAYEKEGKAKREDKVLRAEFQSLGVNYHSRKFVKTYRISKKLASLAQRVI